MTIKVGRVGMVPISSVTIGERAREEMGDIESLETSMQERGLIQPLAMIDCEDGTYELIAGGRRISILQKHGVEEVSARFFDKNISEFERKSIELAENLYRKNFEYHENDALVLEIHRLQQQTHGVKASGPGTAGWSMSDTGDMVGKTKGHVSSAIKRAEAREKFPELFDNCKDQKDAMKLMSKMSDVIIRDKVAKQLEAKSSGALNDLAKRYILKDFFEGVKEIPDGIMKLVEIDPPYAIDLLNAKKTNDGRPVSEESYNEIPAKEYRSFLSKLFKECYRVMAEDSWLICWFGPEPWFEIVFEELKLAGFEGKRMCGLWVKPTGQTKRPEFYLGNAYEMFFYVSKGRATIKNPGHPNTFTFPPVPPSAKSHPTERPVEMMRELYEAFAEPETRLLIPFLGSGNGLFAAYDLGIEAIGFELGKTFRDSFLVRANKKYGGK